MDRFTIRRGSARASAVAPAPFSDAAHMEKLVIEGGYPLSGVITPATRILAATSRLISAPMLEPSKITFLAP